MEVSVTAPAKLTLSLRVTGVRADGFHLLDSEMVSIDLVDTLAFDEGSGLVVDDEVRGGIGAAGVPVGPENLVTRALAAVQRSAAVRLVKRIPVGAGLGGGSADAAAVLRWARCDDPELAVSLGADVPFCVHGGRARVRGVGEVLEPLAFEDRRFVVLMPPVSVDTGAVYARWDDRRSSGVDRGSEDDPGGNDLEAAALDIAPTLARWRDRLAEVTGVRPRLAGSGSSWFVEGDGEELGIADREFLELDGARAPLVAVRTLPGYWSPRPEYQVS